MRKRRVISGLLTALGMAIAIGTIWIVSLALSASPVMLLRPEAAVRRAEDFMNAVCSGDFPKASDVMYGSPSLGTCPEDNNPALELMWDAFLESLEYDFLGDCYASDSGVAIDVRIRSLDISGVVEGLDSYAQALLKHRIETAQDSTEIYDETNNFRQDLITRILQEAVRQVLEENKKYQEHTISLSLVFSEGEWWVLPDAGLLNVLSGSIPD